MKNFNLVINEQLENLDKLIEEAKTPLPTLTEEEKKAEQAEKDYDWYHENDKPMYDNLDQAEPAPSYE